MYILCSIINFGVYSTLHEVTPNKVDPMYWKHEHSLDRTKTIQKISKD